MTDWSPEIIQSNRRDSSFNKARLIDLDLHIAANAKYKRYRRTRDLDKVEFNTRMHFLNCSQISDIHVSRFWDLKRVPDLKQFCTENIDVIRPEVVMATGDLTDAKHADLMGSEQYPEEWHQYYQTLKDTKVMEKTVWLDVKGNHGKGEDWVPVAGGFY